MYHPERRAYTFLSNGEEEETHLTFAELDRRARAIAALLQERRASGQPVLLLYQPGLEYLAAFFGCLYAGAIAIPAYPPRLNHNLERLEAIVADAQPVLSLSSQTLATAAMRKQFTAFSHLGNLPIETTDMLTEDLAAQWREPTLSGETLAFLQYTSGSTGKPKGVMINHRNLLYNHRMFQEALQHPDDAPFVSWLPLFHDMGLIGKALQSVYRGTTCIFLSPFAFLQKPFRWLQAISRYQAYSSYAPNFAYDLCVQKITTEQRMSLDLRCWSNAVNAAEPIRNETLERFVEAFAPCGFRREAFLPGYGLAEATLVVSTADTGRPSIVRTVQGDELERHRVVAASREERRSKNIVSCGHTWLEQEIRIVDPDTRRECPQDRVGEIWVAGPNIAQGYWRRPEETREIFHAHLADSGEGPFMRTGDMGFLDKKELFVTGRLKDLIIIYGQNYYPQDIEMVAEQSHPALRPNCSAAFSLDVAGEERVLLVQEIERQYRQQKPKEIFQAIRKAVLEKYELHIHGIVLIKPGSMPKTSSGKIQRRFCHEALLTRDLPIVFADVPKSIADLLGLSGSENTEQVSVMQTGQPEVPPAPLVERKGAYSSAGVSLSTHNAPVNEVPTPSREDKTMQFSLLYFAGNEAELAENKYQLLLEGARFADQHEFTAVWIPERHFHPFGGLYPNPSVLAAALAVATNNIRLRAGSVVLPMHHPARVAEEWSVVDNLSSGRVDIAFATGWNPNDFVLAPENYAKRREILHSDIQTFRALWRGEAVSRLNGLGQQTEVKIYPRPQQRELIPWITCTGSAERFIEAGAMGANVLTGLLFQSAEELAEKIKLYREARASHGYDPASGHVTLMLHTYIDEDLDTVRQKVRPPFTAYLESSVDLWRHGIEKLDSLTSQEREQVLSYAFERYFHTHALFGTPQSGEKMVEYLSEVGVDEIASLIDFGLDVDTVMDGLHWLNVLRKRYQKRNLSRRTDTMPESTAIPSKASNQKANSLPHVQEDHLQIVGRLDTMAQDQRLKPLRDYLLLQIALVLERNVDELAEITNTRALGLDSLKVMSIVNNCQRDLQVTLDAGQFYDLPSLDSLTLYLAEEYQRSQMNGRVEQLNGGLALRRRERQQRFPQSFAQQRMWFLNQLQPDTAAYNVPTAIHITGEVHVEALRWSFGEIIRRHEILRTTFDIFQGEPVQVINDTATFFLHIVDLSTYDPQLKENEVREKALQEAQQPFDLAHGPLIRATLLLLNQAESMLLLTYHHIIADGWSRDILMRELQTLYTSSVTSQPSSLQELPIQYADFAVWQMEWLQHAVPLRKGLLVDGQHVQNGNEEKEKTLLASQLAYWKKQLSGPLPVLELPVYHPRSSLPTFHGAHLAIHIPEQLMPDLRALSERAGTTLFMTLLASFQILLARYSGQEDILIGSPIAGRTRAETQGLIGFFVNTLVLRTDLSGNPSCEDVLQRVRHVCLQAYAHQEVPFEQVVEAVCPTRDLSRSPLFQVMFNLQEASWWFDTEMAELHLHQVEMESGISVFDITWSVTNKGFGVVEYNTDLFEESTILRMLAHWYQLLQTIVADPLQRLADISLFPVAEQVQRLRSWSDAQKAYSSAFCLHQLFEQQVRRTPNAIAIKTLTESLTYQEVEWRSNQVAHILDHLRNDVELRVGVCMERVPEVIISLLGILKAGGAYVPLDPFYPQERLAFMLEDAQIAVLLTQKSVQHLLPQQTLPIFYLEPAWFQETSASTAPLIMDITPDWLAYIIYTSGSTGLPKGVQVSHKGIQNLVDVQKRSFELQPEDRILQFSSMSFDASIWEVCMSLCTGATLCLESEHIVLAGPALKDALERLEITVVTLPPSLLASLPVTDLPQLRTIIVAGEACPPELAEAWAAGRSFFNAYGPTEATVCATMLRVDGKQKLSIGFPIANAQVYILDASMQLAPIGVPGELYIGGVGLAYGYLNQPGITAECFVPHPFTRQEGERLYKTGDRGRYKEDGTIEFLGRLDRQVKIRGYRIEMDEIEAVLWQHPAVYECAVVARGMQAEDKQLLAYVVPREGRPLSCEGIREYLQQHLPEYMVPAFILPLEQMPLTSSGKIDRKLLPDTETVRQQTATTLLLPSTASERAIAAIWQECLHVEKIGRDEKFFELGAHSLLAIQVHQKLQAHFQRDMALTDVFKYPTISALARYLDQEGRLAHVIPDHADDQQTRQEEALKVGKNRLKQMRLRQEKDEHNDR